MHMRACGMCATACEISLAVESPNTENLEEALSQKTLRRCVWVVIQRYDGMGVLVVMILVHRSGRSGQSL